LLVVWVKFVICIAIIGVAGTRLSKYGDVIAEKTGLSGLWVGVALLAVATSMPELFTSISAVTIVGIPDLAVGDAMGACCWNLLNLAFLDILHSRATLLRAASVRHILPASLSAIAISLTGASILLGGLFTLNIGPVGIVSIILIIFYFFSVRQVFGFEQHVGAELPAAEVELQYEHIVAWRAYLFYAISALVIIGAGTWLAFIGSEIAEVTGWDSSFVGSLFLGFTTTVPEIVVSLSALRIGAIDMAVGNMLGSNLFNIAFVIPIGDLFYLQGPIFSDVSSSHVFTALTVVLMTSILVSGLIVPARGRSRIKVSWETPALIVIFLLGSYALFVMSGL
jgi:cation:H+ antiporter